MPETPGDRSARPFQAALDRYKQLDVDQAPPEVIAMLRGAFHLMLLSYAGLGAMVEVMPGTCCPSCAAEDPTPVTVATELTHQRLPQPTCTEGWCNCDYVPVV